MPQTPAPVIVLFRNDLRVSDNAALHAACASGAPVLPVYILDDETPARWRMGGASRVWLHHSLTALADDLRAIGLHLHVARGHMLRVLQSLHDTTHFSAIYWNRLYEPATIARDKDIVAHFEQNGIAVHRFQGNVLYEPTQLRTKDGNPYRVYTPFYKACMANLHLRPPLPAPTQARAHLFDAAPVDSLELVPAIRWDKPMMEHAHVGEAAAHARLNDFLDGAIASYAADRDRPDREGTSRLSAHLHFGEISVGRIFWAVQERALNADKFLAELVWREFSIHLLYHYPDLPDAPLNKRFATFPWRTDTAAFDAWKHGKTGYPIVDAGMRQLWQTGYMHNRVRMIVASFLVKHLLIPWQDGQNWFWDTLFDADLASNSASWQWVAGCGADAAPYFRIFNPVLQGEKFDPNGDYIRRYVPELAHMPADTIHKPWSAKIPPAAYPKPVVELTLGRERALAALKSIGKDI